MTADMSEEIGNGYGFSVCSLGLFGIAYSRDEPLPTAIELFYGDFPFTFAVQNVYPSPSTGNALDVNLRQAEANQLSFVQVKELYGETMVTIDTSSLPDQANYDLQLESFDSLSNDQLTLKSDVIILTVGSRTVGA